MTAPQGIVASKLARLRNVAGSEGLSFNDVLQSYVIERFLSRIARVPDTESVLLKGALMLRVWGIPRARPTMDIDLLKRGSAGEAVLIDFVSRCAAIVDADDAVDFDVRTIVAESITEDAEYVGTRIRLVARMGTVRQPVQIDFGVGDAVVPGPVIIDYPLLLGGEPLRLNAYPVEAAIAEKYHAIVVHDLANSRLKDFYDVWMLSRNLVFTRTALVHAIRATFSRRKTPLPEDVPPGLTTAFSTAPARVRQWRAFVTRIGAQELSDGLPDVVSGVAAFLMPTEMHAIHADVQLTWPVGGPWQRG